jgi:hypothetical protein
LMKARRKSAALTEADGSGAGSARPLAEADRSGAGSARPLAPDSSE